MRTSNGYQVTTGTDATRKLQVIAEPTRMAGRARIASFDVVANGDGRSAGTRSVTINYTFTQTADARVYIRDGQGRTLRTLNTTTRAAGDTTTGTALWDLKDQKGITLPTGVYSVELVMMDASGNRARQVRPYVMTR
jgi:flagellar hook assembly protein FlgD